MERASPPLPWPVRCCQEQPHPATRWPRAKVISMAGLQWTGRCCHPRDWEHPAQQISRSRPKTQPVLTGRHGNSQQQPSSFLGRTIDAEAAADEMGLPHLTPLEQTEPLQPVVAAVGMGSWHPLEGRQRTKLVLLLDSSKRRCSSFGGVGPVLLVQLPPDSPPRSRRCL